MILKNKFKILSKYKGSTKFDFWKDLSPGQVIYVYMNLKNPGRSERGLYASKVYVQSESGIFVDSITMVSKYLNNIELEEVL